MSGCKTTGVEERPYQPMFPTFWDGYADIHRERHQYQDRSEDVCPESATLAFATVIGPLIEVPVLLALVSGALYLQDRYD